ncbi:hypothetical protein FRB90_002230 [Tulasnella sp. 427]|nr:hypothetical protein FRB90_002230 [Tulasnella sp. 427]
MGQALASTDSSAGTQVRIPSLIGGFPTQDDFAPSIVLIIFYFLSILPWIKRLYDPNTRTITLGSATTCFAIERCAVYAVRLAQSSRHRPGEDLGDGGLAYQQLSFGVGYIGLMVDAVSFGRAVLVNATLEDPGRGSKDRPELRCKLRKILGWMSFALWAVTQVGLVTFGLLPNVAQSQGKANLFRNLRYACDVIPLAVTLLYMGGLYRVRSKVEFLDKSALDAIIKLGATLCIIPIYRLSVLHFTSSTLSIIPTTYSSSTLSGHSDKAGFYLFHALPEILVVYYVHCTNIRARFNTTPHGDWQKNDLKDGIPRLRQEGVIVDGVGVPQEGPEKKRKKEWWLKLCMILSAPWRRTTKTRKLRRRVLVSSAPCEVNNKRRQFKLEQVAMSGKQGVVETFT